MDADLSPLPNPPQPKPHALALKADDFRSLMASQGYPTYRADQVVQWVFEKRVWDPDQMSNLSRVIREGLKDFCSWDLPKITDQLESQDGSTKLLLDSQKGLIETVILRYEGRTSLCVSSQVGCKLACRFCQTGKLGFIRHLTCAEILAQYAIADQIVRQENRRISHVVFMGMGEPLDNYDHVVRAVNFLSNPVTESGYGLSRRNVTVSTSGIVPKIRTLSQDARCALAVSLHAAQDELRSDLMPINRKWNLSELKAALSDYQAATNQTITLEYIMIKDKNAEIQHAKDLVKWIHGLKVKVNLIPFNSHPGLPFERPDDTTIREFQKYLSDRSIPAPVRYSKGLDVSAACGQLAAKVFDTLHGAPKRSSVLTVPVQASI